MRKRAIIVAISLLVVLNIVTVLAWQKSSGVLRDIKKYPLLSVRASSVGTNDIIVNFVDLRSSIHEYFEKLNLKHSFYFEYLPSGVSVREGQDVELAAASLMKLPLVMDLYRVASVGKISLDKEFEVDASVISDDSTFGNVAGISAGTKLTLRQAAKLTLTESDNTAARFISQKTTDLVDRESKALTFLDLPVTQQTTDQGEYVTISAKNYGSILSCLYLSCMLQPEDSSELLTYLTQSDNKSRIPAGVPKNIAVANKLGTFSDQSQSDCGIVYEPQRPYLICMMIFASNEVDARFEEVSKMVYDYVHKAKIPKE